MIGLGLGLTMQRGRAFNPASLFAAGENGAWYDPSDLSSMFQNAEGTNAAVVGMSVGRIIDKSGRGNHLTQAIAAARPILRQDAAGKFYLEFNGVDQFLASANGVFITNAAGQYSSAAGVRFNTHVGTQCVLDAFASPPNLVAQMLRVNGANYETIAANTVPAAFTDTQPALPAGSDVVLSQVMTGTATQIYANGIGNGGVAVTGTPASASSTIKLGAGSAATTGTSVFMGGRVYGALTVGRALSDAERGTLERYMAGGVAL